MSSATGETAKSITSAQTCHHFSLAEIHSATNDFDDELVVGRGGFGKVYKGLFYMEETTRAVAIKRLDLMSNQGETEFRTEIELLSKLRHRCLVSLIGFCDDSKEMILVYEYMPHGTLYDHLHKSDTPLKWVQRLKIAIGAGCGLHYLHTGGGTQPTVIHRDVKSSNILLDEDLAARISDFGLSKVGPTSQSVSFVDASVKGTFGYLDPNYFYTRRLTRKTDVYAFGVVMFELLSGRLPVDTRLVEDDPSLVWWAQKCVKGGKLDEMVDSSIRGTIFPECLRRFAEIADRCLYSVPKEHPPMIEVVASLQLLLELQEKHDSAESSSVMGFTWKISQACHQFTLAEIRSATSDFHDEQIIGKDGYGKVYKGYIFIEETFRVVAIKRLDSVSVQRETVFRTEIEMLSKLCHCRLVSLIGSCDENKEMILVYEYMPHGTLYDHLHKADTPLNWVRRLKIAIGAGRGLDHLHTGVGTQHGVIHRDVKSLNILLDERWAARVSGFGLSMVCPTNQSDSYVDASVKGTFGYLDP